jgi:hypothetical protein
MGQNKMDVNNLVGIGGTGAAITYVSQLMLKRFLEKNEANFEAIKNLEKDVAVLQSKLQTLEKDINGVAAILRDKLK